ncbi:hypothetical protein E2C01_025981 [Portunus trituberculatus]|uniref:Uncharacterized protein n=1 Tax=Portunus trituberculatus TaxID=210409 RepID=A0A5B7EHM2_PORTR|nr:hypothetical protein [Portunus trituberculatus]
MCEWNPIKYAKSISYKDGEGSCTELAVVGARKNWRRRPETPNFIADVLARNEVRRSRVKDRPRIFIVEERHRQLSVIEQKKIFDRKVVPS